MSTATLRRLLHVASGGVALLVPLASVAVFRVVTVTVAVLALAVDVARLSDGAFGKRLTAAVPVFRERERRSLSGATWLWVAFAAAAWLPPRAAVGGIVFGAVADPAAAWIGTRFGPGDRKSWTGTAAALLSGWAVLLLLGWAWPSALAVAALGAGLERWPGPLDDNLLVTPLVAATLAALA